MPAHFPVKEGDFELPASEGIDRVQQKARLPDPPGSLVLHDVSPSENSQDTWRKVRIAEQPR